MPIPFDDLSEPGHSGQVAWLRFVYEEDGHGVRAALFETSSRGEPLGFCFTRIDRRDPSLLQAGNSSQFAVSFLAKSLFQSAKGSPALVLGLAEEIPLWVLTAALRVRLPFCRVILDNENPPQVQWATTQPSQGSATHRILDQVMERDDPFEPFTRAAECLTKALAYRRVRGLTAISGLNAVVTLCPAPLDRQDARSAVAERLWALLALRPQPRRGAPEPSQSLWNSQLEWPGALMPFQQDGVSALLEMKQLLLADEMGLGKTVQAIAALRILKARGEIGACLVVAPASVLDQWRQEITKWAPELSAIIIRGSAADRSWQWNAEKDVTLASYDVVRQDAGRVAKLSPAQNVWDVVVADEAQRIKNRNDTSDAVKGVRRARSWALTGTPIENSEEELASIMEFVDYDANAPLKHFYPGADLLNRHRELQLRRKKSEVLEDLPPKLETKLTIELRPRQFESYRKAEEEGIVYLKSLGLQVKVRHVLELITRLKQICNIDPETGESSKLDDIRERLFQLSAQGHKALIFSQYTNNVSGVAAAANALREFDPLTLTGDTRLDERAAVIERFKSRAEHKALVISLRAGGLGLNLQQASYVFHLDRWWNPAVERQAEDRAHRMGQKVKVNVFKYSCQGTIEERIDQILERKQELFDQLIDDVSLDLSAKLSGQELFGLFGLDPSVGQSPTISDVPSTETGHVEIRHRSPASDP